MSAATPQAPQGAEAPFPTIGPLRALVGRARRRMKLQRAMEYATTWAVGGAAVAAGAMVLYRLGVAEPWLLWRLLGLGLLLPLGGALLGVARPLDEELVARRIDRTHGLHDRLGTALEFVQDPRPGPFKVALVHDALAHAPEVSPRRAAPFCLPRRLRALGMSLVLVAAALLIPPPDGQARRSTPAPEALPGMEVDPDDLAAQRALVETLGQEAMDEQVPDAAALAKELELLLAALERKELTRKELFEQLAALERRFFDSLNGDFDELLRELKRKGGELAKERASEDAGRALQEKKLAKAAKELAALAERLKELDKAARRRLAKRLDRAANQQQPEDRSLARRERSLEQERRRLQRKQKASPSNAQLRRRLQRNKRQLDRLNREAGQHQAQRRQLDRLNRDLSRAAAGLRNRQLSDQARQALKQAASEAGRMGKQVNRARMLKRAQAKVQDLKEMLRRSGKGKGKGKQGRMKDFFARAGGKDGKGKDGKGKGGDGLLLKPGGSGEAVMMEGEGQGQGQGQGEMFGEVVGTSDGVGQGSGGLLKGDKTALDAKRRASLVRGKEGKGASRSEVILGAAEDGFAARDYRKVYGVYTAVVEDVLKREDVPLGYRYYVKRYFQLIRPR